LPSWKEIEKIFRIAFNKNKILPIFIGLMMLVINLVLTLNFLATVLVAILLIAIYIFSLSFSKGWLFLLALILLFPTIKLSSGNIQLFDLLLILISVIGMIKLAITDKKVIRNRLTFPFFLMFLVSFSYLFFGLIFGLLVNDSVWKITLSMGLIWFLLIGFQYFFQTQKRIKKFFSLIITISVIHSVFGIFAFWKGWQTALGMGISRGIIEHPIFNQVNYQINGFLGIGLENRIGNNPLASLLIVGILSSLGLLILNKQQEKVLIKKKVGRKKKIRFLDGIYRVKKFQGKFKNRKLFRKRVGLGFLILIQLIALILTFSYSSLIFLVIGSIVMGILTKTKKLITASMIAIVFLVLVFPNLYSSVEIVSQQNLNQWFGGVETIVSNNWFFGEGVTDKGSGIITTQTNKNNSYLLFWGNYGMIGLLIFTRVLWQYFNDIYKKYRSTEKGERVWFVIVASCFVSLLLEGLTSNILIFGPTAVVFWLMYGVILNLGKENTINDRFKSIKFI
jgi:hypothetical protein